MVARGEGGWGMGTKGEKVQINSHKQSRGGKVQHREYSQQYCNNYAWCQVGTGNTRGTTL